MNLISQYDSFNGDENIADADDLDMRAAESAYAEMLMSNPSVLQAWFNEQTVHFSLDAVQALLNSKDEGVISAMREVANEIAIERVYNMDPSTLAAWIKRGS